MIYVQVEAHLYSGKTYKSLVERLWHYSFDEAINKENFMFNVKERIKQLYDKRISTKNYKAFVEDLDDLGLIKILRCRDCESFIEHPQTCTRGINIINRMYPECPKLLTKEIKRLKVAKLTYSENIWEEENPLDKNNM